jgi:electron transfer flavoprotein alpha subunit
MRVAALVKQIPAFEAMRLGADGRLVRDGLPLEMSAYCRRAVAQGVALAAAHGGSCTVITLGPPSAEDVLREAVAFGADEGVLVTDPAFAGSDTLATARALAATIALVGPFDLVLVGRASVDADTGQVGPELAELLGLPFATGVKELAVHADRSVVDVGLELDDEWVDATVTLPAVLSTAERLIDPCKIKDPAVWAAVPADRIRRLAAADLGPGPWGQAGSPTWVGETRVEVVERDRIVLDGPLEAQVARAVAYLADRGLLRPSTTEGPDAAPPVPTTGDGLPPVAALLEPGRSRLARELLGGAARLAGELGRSTVAIAPVGGGHGPEPVPAEAPDPALLAGWGADHVVVLEGSSLEDDVAPVVAAWVADVAPPVVLAPSTAWGREVASRVAAATASGLTGDAVGLALDVPVPDVPVPDVPVPDVPVPDVPVPDVPVPDAAAVDGGRRLLAWKPAFGGTLVAAVRAESPVQMATVRPGVLPLVAPRGQARPPVVERRTVPPRGRVVVRRRTREDDLDVLANADVVIGVGQGVDPTHYDELEPLRRRLGAELAATRKVTDRGWMPHARQIGITGHAIAPRLYLALGTSGKYNHTVGVRSAGTIVAVNPDPDAPVFTFADVGIVGDWRAVVPALDAALGAALATAPGP